jgi:GNAT superfamily N-acetyltransferase
VVSGISPYSEAVQKTPRPVPHTPAGAKKEETMNKATHTTLKEGFNILTVAEIKQLPEQIKDQISDLLREGFAPLHGNPILNEMFPDLAKMSPQLFKGAMVINHLNSCVEGDNWIALQVENGQVIATCGLNRSLSDHTLGYSYFLYVDESHRLNGHATATFAGVMSFAQEQGMTLIETDEVTKMEAAFYATTGAKYWVNKKDQPCHRIKLA